MAIPFLTNLNLNDNELQNVKLHLTGASPGDNQGQFYLNSGTNKFRVYTTEWKNVAFEDWVTSNFNNYVLPLAADGTRGGLQIGYVENGKNYPVELTSEKAFVNVPWTDTTVNETITLSGDLSGSGTSSINATIVSDAVEAGMLNDNVISGQTALTSGLVSTDEFLISDAGTIKRMDVSVLETYMQSNLTFTVDTSYDLTVLTGGANTSVIRLAGSDATNDDVTVSGTSTTVKVTESGNTITLDLQDDVTIVNDLTVGGDINVTGSLNSYTTSELLVQDQYITLNSGQTSGVLDAFVKVERGATDVAIKWNETTDRWQFTNDGSTYYNIPVSSEYDNFNFNVQVGGTSQEVADGGTLTFAQGGGLTVAIGGDDTITYSHADTSSQASVNNSGLTVVQDITVDTYGHVTAIGSQDITSAVVSEITNRQIALLVGDGSATSIDLVNSGATAPDVNHLLGTDSSQFMIQLIDASSGETVYADVTRGASGLVTLDFATAPSTNGIRVLIIFVGGSF